MHYKHFITKSNSF